MNTYSHYLTTRLLKKHVGEKGIGPMLLGSVMPDVPLGLLTLGYWLSRRGEVSSPGELFGAKYDALYHGNAGWLVGQSLFHAPMMIFLVWGLGRVLKKHSPNWGRRLQWFALGCALHTTIDIFTHFDDGPLILFPFNWQYRFSSPISYWDPAHGGRIFAPLEHLLDLSIIIWWVIQRKRGKA